MYNADYDFAKSKSAYVFKSIVDPYIGKYSLIKVNSGVLKTDDVLYNYHRDCDEKIGKLYVCLLYTSLKGMLDQLVKKMFGKNVTTRLRPSYFPFTEPSVEVAVSCFQCPGKGCSFCKGTGWIEAVSYTNLNLSL